MASRVAARVGGLPAARTLVAVLAVFDRAGGGLVAGGLAYAALFALLPALLLVLSVVGLLVGDLATRERLAHTISVTLPPLEGVAREAVEQIANGAVPTGIVAFVALIWGSSRFYSVLDRAFAHVFDDARRRGELERTLRGLALTVLVIGLPAAVLLAGSVATWAVDAADTAPEAVAMGGAARTALRFGEPLALAVTFVVATALVYRFVPARRVPASAFRRPAITAGIALAAFTQAFALLAPRLVGSAAVYGTFVAVFALLVWLSVGFNVLLLGAAWTRVREAADSSGTTVPPLPEPAREPG
jgi:membrane protein